MDDPQIDKQEHSCEGSGGTIARSRGTLTMREALYYTVSLPVSTVILGCSLVAQLEENVQLAREFAPLSDRQMALQTRNLLTRQCLACFT